ncbi:hypothetical protein HGI15_21985 [Modestobacter lapidis]|nr:hypothetical protein [Modestobacter lapidis]
MKYNQKAAAPGKEGKEYNLFNDNVLLANISNIINDDKLSNLDKQIKIENMTLNDESVDDVVTHIISRNKVLISIFKRIDEELDVFYKKGMENIKIDSRGREILILDNNNLAYTVKEKKNEWNIK